MTYSLLHAIKEKQAAAQSVHSGSIVESKAGESFKSDSKHINSIKSYDQQDKRKLLVDK